MPFKKGQSGNPGGRNTEKEYTAALRAAVNVEDPKTKRRKLQIIAEVAANAAVDGEPWAIAHIADRLDGKPAQEQTVNLRRLAASQVSDDELADIAVGGSEGTAQAPLDPQSLN